MPERIHRDTGEKIQILAPSQSYTWHPRPRVNTIGGRL